MSTVSLPQQVNQTTSQGVCQTGNVVPIVSPSLARAALAELMLKPDALSEAMRKALAGSDNKKVMAALERMTIWVDLSTLAMTALRTQEIERRQAALKYCVLRQANFGLLQRLFKVSRYEVQDLRRELQVAVETRPKIIVEGLDDIYRQWQKVTNEYVDYEADRWIALAELFPQHGLNSLYQVIVKDGD